MLNSISWNYCTNNICRQNSQNKISSNRYFNFPKSVINIIPWKEVATTKISDKINKQYMNYEVIINEIIQL